jgi:hypothetical protein
MESNLNYSVVVTHAMALINVIKTQNIKQKRQTVYATAACWHTL